MSIRPILIAPDPRLTRHSAPITPDDGTLPALIRDLTETLRHTDNGIGLSAPQIGINKRIFAVQIDSAMCPIDPYIVINPVILSVSTEVDEDNEGCLSLPTYYENVTRPRHIQLRYQDSQFTTQTCAASGLIARCYQHEIDHLNGVLFIDYLSPLKKRMALRKCAKIKKKQDRLP
ncbi:MAG: peptide deformylase [Alphaproteobacteria bacterium GM7ARS4]|nr:peptide deformylase [Alphaproteobacteria bacterium GM7ARS4]